MDNVKIVDLRFSRSFRLLIWNLFIVAFSVVVAATMSGCFESSDTNETGNQKQSGSGNRTTVQPDAGEQPDVDNRVTTVTKIVPCPGADASEVDVDDYSMRGGGISQDELILDIEFDGCESDDIALCYENEFLDIFTPVKVNTRFIRLSPKKDCVEDGINRTLEIDLSPLASSYKARYHTEGGLIALLFGPYIFGELSCQDRQNATEIRVSEALIRTDKTCTDSSDCMSKTVVTSCYFQCNAGVISLQTEQQLEDAIAKIDDEICGDLETAGCEYPGVHPCPGPLQADCIDGICVDVNSAFSKTQRCAKAFNFNRTLEACSSDCSAYDGCCSNILWCVHDHLHADDKWLCEEPETTSCAAGEPNASISGTTPLGPVDFRYGLAIFSHAFSVNLQLIFNQTDSAKTCENVRLGIKLDPFSAVVSYGSRETDNYAGLYGVPVTLFKDNNRVVGSGRIEILSFDEHDNSLKGSLEVVDENWDLHGEFELGECDELGRGAP